MTLFLCPEGVTVSGDLCNIMLTERRPAVIRVTNIFPLIGNSPPYKTHLNADMYGVGETLGGALPDDGEDLLEVGLVQLLLEEQHVLVEVLYGEGKKRWDGGGVN